MVFWTWVLTPDQLRHCWGIRERCSAEYPNSGVVLLARLFTKVDSLTERSRAQSLCHVMNIHCAIRVRSLYSTRVSAMPGWTRFLLTSSQTIFGCFSILAYSTSFHTDLRWTAFKLSLVAAPSALDLLLQDFTLVPFFVEISLEWNTN